MDYPGQSSHDPVQNALSMDYPGKEKTNPINPAAGPSRTERFKTGLGDLEFGLGQLAEHAAEKPLNWLRAGLRSVIRGQNPLDASSYLYDQVANDKAKQILEDKSSEDFDKIVQTREQDYQAARAAAGQTGIDWWRLGGEAANPLNYLSAGGAAETVTGRIAQSALQGGAINAAQPDANSANYSDPNTPGSFWWDKAKSFGMGALAGGATSAVIEGAVPLLKGGLNYIRSVLPNAANTTAAENIVNEALRAKGVDPASIDLNVLSGMKQEVQDALSSGAEPESISATAIANRAKAESLPVPIPLTRGMASRDPGLMTDEFNLMQLKGVGDPLRNRVQGINEGIKDNLDALGADSEQDIVSTGQKIDGTVNPWWDKLEQKNNELYDSVKNSQGQSALVDGASAATEIREQLGKNSGSSDWFFLPQGIKDMVGELENGMPFTVSNLQALDKSWGGLAAGAENGTVANAINQARGILAKANIADEVGDQSMQAYQAAKQIYAGRMSMVTPKLLNDRPNPAYQPLLDDIIYGGAAPEKLFQDHFLNESGSQAGKNMQFLSQIDPDMKKTIGNTVFTEIKRQATGGATAENAPVSESVLRNWARSPQKSSVLENLLPTPQLQTFRNLSDTASNAKLFPAAAVPNRSGSGAAVLNAVGSAAKSYAKNVVGNVPGVKQIITPMFEGAAQVGRENAVNSALRPGVTLKSMLTSSPTGKRALSKLVTTGLVGAIATEKNKPKPPEQ